MKYHIISLIAVSFMFMVNTSSLCSQEPIKGKGSKSFVNHEKWDILLKKYVAPDGLVDYRGFQKDTDALDAYLQYLSEHTPSEGWSLNEKLAYYINLYNAATVRLILDHYPLQSIKDISRPWDRKWISMDGEAVSLGHLEHKILRKYDEPRIHFAINCASFSCPPLLDEAYTADKMEGQLEKVTRNFISGEWNNIGPTLQLSSIFKWYREDFKGEGGVINFLNRYTGRAISQSAKIDYIPYDWSLNEKS